MYDRKALAERLRSAREPRCACGSAAAPHYHLGERDCPAFGCPCQVERPFDAYWTPVVVSTPAYSFTAS
jgi:hypothetical protein